MNRDEYYSALLQNQNVLEHHGIQGQKHGLRRYQYEDGSLTPLGRIRYGIGQKRKMKNGTVKAVPAKPQKTKEELKADSIKKADVRYVSKNATEYTTQELNDVKNRYVAMQNIHTLAAAEIEAGKKYSLKKLLDKAYSISTEVKKANDTYNNIKPMLIKLGLIDEKNQNNNNNNQKDEKK